MARQLIALTNGWGTHFGGINAFNCGLMKALGRHERCQDIALICVVESATDDEKKHAEHCGVRLLESGVDMLSNVPSTVDAVASLVGDDAPRLWLGHDDKTGPLALALREKLGGKAVIVNHMAHVAYQGFKKSDSHIADAKKELQLKLFLQADQAVCVGPRLHAELDDLLSTSPSRPSVTMLMPGLDDPGEYGVSYRQKKPICFRGFAAGRLSLEDDRIKQGRLALRGFAEAVRGQKATGKIPALAKSPRVCLMGVEKEREGELRKKLESWADRQLQVELISFSKDRTKYFRELAGSSFAMMLSWHEGFGLVGWEAIAARVPLILGRNSGLWQFLEENIGAAHVGQCIFPLDIRGHLADEENSENHRHEDVEAVKDAIERIAVLGDVARQAAIELHDLIVSKGWTWERAAQNFIASIEPLFATEVGVSQTGHTMQSAASPPPPISPLAAGSEHPLRASQEPVATQELSPQTRGTSSPRNHFKQSLVHWTVEDELPLPGRAGIIRDVVEAMTNQGDFILLKGRSGCGKSSLMQRGVMRKLREKDGSMLVPFRPTELMAGSREGDALERLTRLIAECVGVPFPAGGPVAMRPGNYAKRLQTALERANVSLVVGLDQFEEVIDELKLERERSTGTPRHGWWLVIRFLKELCGSPRVRLIATLESAREEDFRALRIGEAIGLNPKTVNVDVTDDTVAEIAKNGFHLGGLPLDPAVIEVIKRKWTRFEGVTPSDNASPLPLACLFLQRLYERFADQAGATAGERLDYAFAKAGAPDRDHLLTLEEIGGEDAIDFFDIIQNLADEAWRLGGGDPNFADPIETDDGYVGLNNFMKPLVWVDHSGQIRLRTVVEADADNSTRRKRKAFREHRLLVPVPVRGEAQQRLRLVHQALIDHWSPARRWFVFRRQQLQIVQRFREDANYWYQRGKPVPLEADGSTLRAAAMTLFEHILEWQLRTGEYFGADDSVVRDQALAVFDSAKDPFAVVENNSSGKTYAHLAAAYHRVDLLRRFTAVAPECLKVEDRTGENLLHSAAWSKGPAVQFLMDQGVSTTTESSQWNAIACSITEKLDDNFDAMLGRVGLDDPIETSMKWRMIHVAAGYGNMYVLEQLVRQGAHLAVQDEQGSTALHIAAQFDQADAFRYLLPHIDVQKENSWKGTAISVAALCGAGNVLSTYLTDEADPSRLTAMLSQRNNMGDTPLMMAARYRQPKALQLLLQPGLGEFGDPSAVAHRGEGGNTLFHRIFQGASSEEPTETERFGARDSVDILLKDGRLDPNLPNDKGEAPFDLAGAYPEARRVLREDERVPRDYAKMSPAMRIEDLSSSRPATVLRLLKEAPRALTDVHQSATGRPAGISAGSKKLNDTQEAAVGETGLEILIRRGNLRVLAILAEDSAYWPTLHKAFQGLLTAAIAPSAQQLRRVLQRKFANGELNANEAGGLLGACLDAGDVQTARDLVAQGAPLTLRRDERGATVLHRAAISGAIERFQSVLSIGPFALPRDQWGRCPSDLAAASLIERFRALEVDMAAPAQEKAPPPRSCLTDGQVPLFSLERREESRAATEKEMAVLQLAWKDDWGSINAREISVFDLPFHPGVPLIELRRPSPGSSTSATARICFLLQGDDLYRLDGASWPIHEANARGNPVINEETVLPYLAFFCFFVRGTEGPFLVMDRWDNGFLPDLGVRRSEIETIFRQPQVWGTDERGNWLASSLVIYADAVFLADFSVQPNGFVEMLDDTTLLADLQARVDAPLDV